MFKEIFCKHNYYRIWFIGGDTQQYGYRCLSCGKKKVINKGIFVTNYTFDGGLHQYLWLNKEKEVD